MKKKSLVCISFLQATGVVVYCLLVALLMWKSNDIFGKIQTFLGPALFVILFVVSAMITALMALGYPIYLFWDEKKTKKSLKLVSLTAAWLLLYTVTIITLLIVF